MTKQNLKLPEFCVKGPLDQLMEVETLMIFLGYISDEEWNEYQFNGGWATDKPWIKFNDQKDGGYGYFSHPFATEPKTFKTDQLPEILLYVEAYQKQKLK